jgi:hypothetical protein
MTLFWVAAFFLVLLMIAGRTSSRRYAPRLVAVEQSALPTRTHEFTEPVIYTSSFIDQLDAPYAIGPAGESSIASQRCEPLPPLPPIPPLEPIQPIER